MSTDELAQLELQIAELRAKQNALIALKEQYNYDWHDAIKENDLRFPPSCTLSAWDIHLEYEPNKFSFRIDPPTDAIINALRTIPTRSYSMQRNYVHMKYYQDLINALPNGTIIEMAPDIEAAIKAWKPVPDFTFDLICDINGTPTKGMVTLKNPSNEWLFKDKLRTGTYHHQLRQCRFDLFECEAALDLIKDRSYVFSMSDRYNDYLKQTITIDDSLQIPVPERFKLRPFQEKGIRTVIANDLNFLIGDEMGLGKSPQAILAAEYLIAKDPKTTVLIVCPAALKGNWARQVFKWTGKSCFILWGQRPTADQIATIMTKGYNYFIINYDPLATDVDDTYLWVNAINIGKVDLIIVDEIHYIKNLSSKRSKAVLQLEAKHKIGLSGTLLVNRPRELWAPLKFVRPDLADSYEAFMRFYEKGRVPVNLAHLRSTLSKAMIRRTKREVMPDLPPINRIYREYDLTPTGNNIYNLGLQSLWRALDAWGDDEKDNEAITNILTQILRLKQICAKDKIDYIADLAIELYENNTTDNRKVIIFSQFTNAPAMIDSIARRLDKECVHFTGEMPPHERLKLVDKFQSDPLIKYLVCSIGSAKEGLDITAAGSVIFTDFAWTPKDHTQAEARAYGRMNDPHSVDAYYIMAEDTVDEEIIKLIQKKYDLAAVVLDNEGDADSIGSIQMDLLKVLKAQRVSKRLRENKITPVNEPSTYENTIAGFLN